MRRTVSKKDEIWIGEVESTVNDALEASLMVHDYLEDLLQGFATYNAAFAPQANTGLYAIKHLRNAITAAHVHFHALLQQELGKSGVAA